MEHDFRRCLFCVQREDLYKESPKNQEKLCSILCCLVACVLYPKNKFNEIAATAIIIRIRTSHITQPGPLNRATTEH